MKICSMCNEEKSESEYYTDNSSPTKRLFKKCKTCFKKYSAEKGKDSAIKRYQKNKNNPEFIEKTKEYYKKRKDSGELQSYRDKNRERISIKRKESSIKNADRDRAQTKIYSKNRYRKDPIFKARINLRNRLNAMLKKNKTNKSIGTMDLLGCDMEFFIKYIESKFQEGMTWENHGMYGWHLDHIIPCKSFDLTKEEEQKKCFHYSNIQPLWAEENIKKSDKIIDAS